MAETGRYLWLSSSLTPAQSMLLKTKVSLVFNISTDRDSIAAVGNLLHCPTILTDDQQQSSLTFTHDFLNVSLQPLVLSTTEQNSRSPSLTSTPPAKGETPLSLLLSVLQCFHWHFVIQNEHTNRVKTRCLKLGRP